MSEPEGHIPDEQTDPPLLAQLRAVAVCQGHALQRSKDSAFYLCFTCFRGVTANLYNPWTAPFIRCTDDDRSIDIQAARRRFVELVSSHEAPDGLTPSP